MPIANTQDIPAVRIKKLMATVNISLMRGSTRWMKDGFTKKSR